MLIAAFALWCLLPFLLRRKTPIVRRAECAHDAVTAINRE